jgi:hypothetical protein
LWKAICQTFGDGEAVTEFDPPRPTDPETDWYHRAACVTIGANTRADVSSFVPYFTGGYCPECGVPRGPRNELPLNVERIETGADGAFATVPLPLLQGRPSPSAQLFSEAFQELLTSREASQMTWRRVERRQVRARKAFYELLHSAVHISEVGVRGVPSKFGGWRCRTCGSTSIGMFCFPGTAHTPHHWITIEDLPKPLPTCFTISKGSGRDLCLCMSRARWEAIMGKPGARGLASSLIGVVDRDRVQMPTDLPFLDDRERSDNT